MNPKINSILSNPNFNVEEYVYYLNLHFSSSNRSQSIINTLIEDPHILISIANGEGREILSHFPPKKEVYEKLSSLGYETWVKNNTTCGYWWRGIIIQDDLAIFGKSIHTEACTVYAGENAAEKARLKFKRYKMYNDKSDKRSSASLIYSVRSQIIKVLNKIVDSYLFFSYRNGQNRADCPHIRYDFPQIYYNRMTLSLLSRGHSILIKLQYGRLNTPNKDEQYSIKINIRKDPKSKIDKSYRNPQAIAKEIIDFIRENYSDFDQLCTKHQSAIDALSVVTC